MQVEINVHKHYITTRVRFYHNSDAYTEFCVCDHLFPVRLFQTESRNDLYAICLKHVETLHSDFPTFAYPAYLSIGLTIDGEYTFNVTHAKYVESQRGIIDFTRAFQIGTYDIRLRVLENLAALIASRDAEKLNSLILTLRTASGGAFKKLT